MIIDWSANVYFNGPGQAFPAPPLVPSEASHALVYNLWSPVRAEYGGTLAEARDTFSLIYRPGLGFIWVQYGGTATGASIWECGGRAAAVFQAAAEAQLWWRADGDAVTTWFLQADIISGFRADGIGTCQFLNLAAGGFVAQGSSTCTFVAGEPAPSYGFRADGKGECMFLAAIGTGDECLTPPDTPISGGSFPNFVY